ncbi:MAG: J domain-containing protein [Deltaproteobacteria bacterium]|nr:J domain-containing protein [Deltaproteobacteria bacterium]
MNVKRYLEILELQPGASLEELNQAYKDLVNIWHPDRFAHNPRLKGKAEKKLKEVNQAYEALRPLLSSGSGLGKNARQGSRGQAQADAGIEEETSSVHHHAGAKSQTEALVEASTANVLRMWSYLSTRLRRLVGEQVQAFKEGAYTDQQGANRGQGSCVEVGRGEDRGRPRRQRMGRGKGRAGGRGRKGGRSA